jgi:hypothetical protein
VQKYPTGTTGLAKVNLGRNLERLDRQRGKNVFSSDVVVCR